MKSFSDVELGQLAGEVLPERAVLSTLLVGGGGGPEFENANINAHHGNGTVVVPNCQSHVQSSQGLAGILAPESSATFVCASSTVVTG